MLQQFKEHISQNFPEFYQTSLIVACSGGLDSSVLAHLLHEIQLDFTLAHVNFKLRGEASDEDRFFVQILAKQFNFPFKTVDFDTLQYVESSKESIQMVARKLRYEWFDQLVLEGVGTLLLTAHHADDALETFLINLSRSSGIDGLSGIPLRNRNIRRPLLIFNRSELEAYAKSKGIVWREDASNSGMDYVRNRVRHQIVPIIKQVFPDIVKASGNTLQHLQESQQLLKVYIENLKNDISVYKEGEWQFSCEKLKRLDPLKPHMFEIFKDFGFTDWDSVLFLLESESGKEVSSPTHRMLRGRNELLIRPLVDLDAFRNQKFYLNNPEKLPIRLVQNEVTQMGEFNSNTLYVDADSLKEPLYLRKWKKGDRFCPFGHKSSKLVSKYFKDIGLSQFEKEDIWLLCSGLEIVWVVGKRPDNRFRITPNTQKILKIKWEEN